MGLFFLISFAWNDLVPEGSCGIWLSCCTLFFFLRIVYLFSLGMDFPVPQCTTIKHLVSSLSIHLSGIVTLILYSRILVKCIIHTLVSSMRN